MMEQKILYRSVKLNGVAGIYFPHLTIYRVPQFHTYGHRDGRRRCMCAFKWYKRALDSAESDIVTRTCTFPSGCKALPVVWKFRIRP